MKWFLVLHLLLFCFGCSSLKYEGKKGDASYFKSESPHPMQYSALLEFTPLALNSEASKSFTVDGIDLINALQLRAYLKSGTDTKNADPSYDPIRHAREKLSGYIIKFTVYGPMGEILDSSTLDLANTQLWSVPESPDGILAWGLIANLLDPPSAFLIQVDVVSVGEPTLWLIIKGLGTERGIVGK